MGCVAAAPTFAGSAELYVMRLFGALWLAERSFFPNLHTCRFLPVRRVGPTTSSKVVAATLSKNFRFGPFSSIHI